MQMEEQLQVRRQDQQWGSGTSVTHSHTHTYTHRVMRSVPLRDWLVLEAEGSSLGRAEPMAWQGGQGGVLGLPGQQVKQSGESKAVTHSRVHKETHIWAAIANM